MDEIKSPQDSSPAQGANPLEALLSDPATMARLAGIMSALQNNQGSPAEPKAAQPPTTAPAQGTDGLSALLSDPALSQKLPQIIALLKPMLSQPSSPTVAPPQATETSSLTPSHSLDRDRLLLSLKPFLSDGRKNAIDSMIRISKLGEVLKQIK